MKSFFFGVSSFTKEHLRIARLLGLAALAFGLTTQALAMSEPCVYGQMVQATIVCAAGGTPYADCECWNYDATTGYSNCHIFAACI